MLDTDHSNPTVRFASGLSLLLGLWLIAAPWALGYEGSPAMWNEVLVGVTIAIVSIATILDPLRLAKVSWLTVALGIWLLIAPFILSYGPPLAAVEGVNPALWNDIFVGILIVVLGWLSASMVTREKR